MEHTKGPWKIDVWDYRMAKRVRSELTIRNDAKRIAVLDWDEGLDNPFTIQNDEALANARLISAAPDLLEALRVAKLTIEAEVSTLDDVGYIRDTEDVVCLAESMKKIYAAIAKAEGR